MFGNLALDNSWSVGTVSLRYFLIYEYHIFTTLMFTCHTFSFSQVPLWTLISKTYPWLFHDNICVSLTHWGRVMHICVGKLTIIGSDNGLSPTRRQAIIRTNAGMLLIGTLGTKFSEILSEIHTFSFIWMHLKMSSGKWRPFCLGLNELTANYCLL